MSLVGGAGAGMLLCWLSIGLGMSVTPGWASWRDAAVVPRPDPRLQAKAERVFARGFREGQRADVFAKVGDSISAMPAFMQGLGCGRWSAGPHSELAPTVRFFARRALPGTSAACSRVNSFSRSSAATQAFAISGWALVPGASHDPACRSNETPLACELRIDRPSYAVVLYGTNDVTAGVDIWHIDALPEFLENMRRIIKVLSQRGVLPVLNTIPPRTDGLAVAAETERFNVALYRLARRWHLPIINLWRAFHGLPNEGLAPGDVHPSFYCPAVYAGLCNPGSNAPACQAASFTRAGLKYGHDVRNLVTLETLARLRRVAQQHSG